MPTLIFLFFLHRFDSKDKQHSLMRCVTRHLMFWRRTFDRFRSNSWIKDKSQRFIFSKTRKRNSTGLSITQWIEMLKNLTLICENFHHHSLLFFFQIRRTSDRFGSRLKTCFIRDIFRHWIRPWNTFEKTFDFVVVELIFSFHCVVEMTSNCFWLRFIYRPLQMKWRSSSVLADVRRGDCSSLFTCPSVSFSSVKLH